MKLSYERIVPKTFLESIIKEFGIEQLFIFTHFLASMNHVFIVFSVTPEDCCVVLGSAKFPFTNAAFFIAIEVFAYPEV